MTFAPTRSWALVVRNYETNHFQKSISGSWHLLSTSIGLVPRTAKPKRLVRVMLETDKLCIPVQRAPIAYQDLHQSMKVGTAVSKNNSMQQLGAQGWERREHDFVCCGVILGHRANKPRILRDIKRVLHNVELKVFPRGSRWTIHPFALLFQNRRWFGCHQNGNVCLVGRLGPLV